MTRGYSSTALKGFSFRPLKNLFVEQSLTTATVPRRGQTVLSLEQSPTRATVHKQRFVTGFRSLNSRSRQRVRQSLQFSVKITGTTLVSPGRHRGNYWIPEFKQSLTTASPAKSTVQRQKLRDYIILPRPPFPIKSKLSVLSREEISETGTVFDFPGQPLKSCLLVFAC